MNQGIHSGRLQRSVTHNIRINQRAFIDAFGERVLPARGPLKLPLSPHPGRAHPAEAKSIEGDGTASVVCLTVVLVGKQVPEVLKIRR